VRKGTRDRVRTERQKERGREIEIGKEKEGDNCCCVVFGIK